MAVEKTLLLVRHAKSSHEIAFLEDKLRPLAARGKSDSQLIGNRLSELRLIADQVFCSSAVRTKATLAILNEQLNLPDQSLSYHDDLYTFNDDGSTYVKHLHTCDEKNNTVMILSHNNSCLHVADIVSDGNIMSFPTCAVLICKWHVESWSDVRLNNVSSHHIITPKQLKPFT